MLCDADKYNLILYLVDVNVKPRNNCCPGTASSLC